jgi:hypothetical protein
MRIVIEHREMGIYLGSFLGMGFWSKLDLAGQDQAVTFTNETEAQEFVSSWDENNDPNDYTYRRVNTSEAYISLESLRVRQNI